MINFQKNNIDTINLLLPILDKEDINKDFITNQNSYTWYYDYGFNFRPKNILEIGTRYGYSLISILKGIEAYYKTNNIDYNNSLDYMENIFWIDYEEIPGSNEITMTNLRLMFSNIHTEKPNIKYFNNSVESIKDDSIFENKKFDLIHLDAQHNEKILNELRLTWDLLDRNGIMIIDDISSFETHPINAHYKKTLADEFVIEKTYRNEVYWSLYINTFRGNLIIKKK